MRTSRWAVVPSALAVAIAGLSTLAIAAPAQAAAGDGIIKVRVVQDFNGDGGWDDAFIEPGIRNVDVEITNQAGVTVTRQTDGDGLVTFLGAPGSYRIVAINPDPAKFDPAPAHEKTGSADTPAAKWLSSNEEFIDVRANQTIDMTTAFWDIRDYCQSNPLIVTACQPPMFQSNGRTANNAAGDTLVTAPYRAEGVDVSKTVLSTKADTGSLYGIGYRKQDKRIFAGAFAKRGSDYGPDGPGAIYVTDAAGGPAALWGTVPNVGTTTHTYDQLPGGRLDWNFASAVGKESLGDLDVSEDGMDLQVINLFTRELLVYDASAATMGAPTHTVDLSANPGCATAGDWRPAALGERNGILYVGGVCSAESSNNPADMKAMVQTYDATTYTLIDTVMDQTLTARRENNGGSGCVGRPTTTYRPWSDVGIACNNKSGQIPDPQAWMTDIVVENNGDLIVGFRDRTGDQMLGVNSIYFSDTTGAGGNTIGTVNYNVTGDINKACPDVNGKFVLDMNGACGIAPVATGQVAGEFFRGDSTIHAEAAFGGLALSRGERGVAANAMDPMGIFTQGYASIGRATGGAMQTIGNGSTPDPDEYDGGTGSSGNRLTGADGFGKGQGMADMEVLCDFAPIQIGNRVWDDANGDGIQDAGEKGIAGVTVNIYDDQGVLVATKVTNSRGEYYFDSVTDGIDFNTDYVIRLDKPEDHVGNGKLSTVGLTGEDVGTDDRLDSDATTVNGYPEAAITTGNRGKNDHTIDFGFKPASVSVGNFVWIDSDGDGVQEDGEPGIQGAVLTLVDKAGNPVKDINGNTVGPVTTDANGHYVFDNLPVLTNPADYYQVRLDNNQSVFGDYLPTQTGQGTSATDSSNGTANSGPLQNPGDRDLTLDFGFMPRPVAVGNLIWVDSNGDGIQDPGEPGIPGVTVTLTGPGGLPVTDINGNPVGPVTTDANGNYSFVDLPVLPNPNDRYTVHVDNSQTALAPYLPTQVVGDPGDGNNSSTGSATSGPLTDAQARDMTLDFGFVPQKVSVGDFVWADSDRDGVQDTGEPGIKGVVMMLTDEAGNPVTDVNGNLVGPVTTDVNGEYSFDNLPVLPAGDHYVVTIDRDAISTKLALEGYAPTQTGQGTSATDSSDWTAESGDLTADGQRDATLDFGFIKPAVSVGNFVWDDLDKDGIQDAGESGIPGVVMVLTGPDGGPVTDINGQVVAPRPTGPNGGYSFDDLPALPAGQSYTVSIDRNHQSTKDALALYIPTLEGQGADRSADSSTWTAKSRDDLTGDGDRDATLDFGFFRPEVSVGDYVWFDNDKDGIQDSAEAGIRGVVLELTGPTGDPVTDIFGNPVGPVTTGPNGGYSFDHLPALPAGQHYTVTIDEPASAVALKGLAPSPTGQGNSNNDSSTGSAISGDLTIDGARDSSLDFGFYQLPGVSVGDFVWEDKDRDGTQDAGEPGIPGVVLVLTGPDGAVKDLNGNPVGPVTTDANGRYNFANLPPLAAGESYTVTVDQAASAVALAPFVPTKTGGGDSANDSSTGSATSGDLTAHGDRDATLDFGFVRPAVSVGDLVWLDKDKDGVQDNGEPGIDGVVLLLTGPNGQRVTDVNGDVVGPITTGPDGKYLFENLPPLPAGQSYKVEIDRTASSAALAGYAPTKTGEGTPATDSSTWSATTGDLVADGDRDLTLDFGFIVPAVSVGDLVWRDNDRDGVQDAGEPGIEGVVLVLTGPNGPVTDLDGNVVGPITTGPDGTYSFDNLPVLEPGQSYTVSVDVAASGAALGGLVPTLPGRGGADSDSSTGSASSGDLVKDGDRDATLDFGFAAPVAVDGVVWVDQDKDGKPEAGEPRIPGVVLVLTDPAGQPVSDLDGNPVGPITTGPDGTYSFENLPLLPPGQQYVVTIDKAASAAALGTYKPTPVDPASPFDFGFVPPTKATLKTKARKLVVAAVNANGSMKPVVLKDAVTVKGLNGTGEGVAKLYGPAPKRTSNMCTTGNLAGTVKFTARNGTHSTPGVKVSKPGVYTWVVTVEGKDGATLAHKCGLAAETTRVQRQGYAPIAIETGKSAQVSGKVGAAGALSASAIGLRNSPVLVVGVNKGKMVIPHGATEIGWLNRSAQFGDAIGTSIVAAHVSDNSDNPMAFWKLRNLKKGKVVTVNKNGKTYRYKVTATAKFSRDKGPGIPKRYFKTSGAHRLVLVTCTDKVTTRSGGFHYSNNLVVTAKLIK